ncbi:hypothetical protein ACG9XS_20450 [Acinetobacter gyllenbergii]|uniref:hypothetical protein n=1 Tax=Acinetobacter gyllenbergii TaxID=134534 RepID=UPI003AF64B3B
MTTLICWAGADSRATSSLYIASDSRISWEGTQDYFDVGQKLFYSKNYPHAFGFSGLITGAQNLLNSLVRLIDNGYLNSNFDNETNALTIRDYFQNCFNHLPNNMKLELIKTVNIIHINRINNSQKVKDIYFHVNLFTFSPKGCEVQILDISSVSQILHISGSGTSAFKSSDYLWEKFDPDNSRTSRSFFSAFCTSLETNQDPYSGGAPQLLGLYRQGPVQDFGIIWDNKNFIAGVETTTFSENVEWRNKTFERCDPWTKKLLQGAQPQPNFFK